MYKRSFIPSASSGVEPVFLAVSPKLGAGRKQVLIFARAACPKRKWVIDKREKTAGCLPLARSAAAQAAKKQLCIIAYKIRVSGTERAHAARPYGMVLRGRVPVSLTAGATFSAATWR